MKDALTRLVLPFSLMAVPFSVLHAQEWTLSTDTGSHSFHALAVASSTAAWAAASGPQGQVFFFDGASWSLQTTLFSSGGSLRGAYAYDDQHVWAVGAYTPTNTAKVFFFNGTSWIAQASTADADFHSDVFATDTSNVWAVGYGDRIYRTTNGGSNWSLETDLGSDDFLAISGLDGEHIWCVEGPGSTGMKYNGIYFYNGTSWVRQTKINLPPSQSLRGIAAVSESDVWATGDDNLLLHFNGTTWTVMSSGGTSSGDHPIAALSSGELRAAPSDGTNAILRYNGAAWTVETNLGAAVRSLDGSVPGSVWAGTDEGMIFHLHFATPTASPSPVPSPTPEDNHALVLDFSTYLGGSDFDGAYDLAVDGSENVYLVGATASDDFPTNCPPAGSVSLSSNVFVSKLAPSGSSLLFSILLGGSTSQAGYGVAVDSLSCVYVTGITSSSNFPTVNPYQASRGGAGGTDAFAAKFDSTGSVLVYSTYLGGDALDEGRDIGIDPWLHAYVGGFTNSDTFPTLNPYQATRSNGKDAFVSKIHVTGSALVYSTYFGGASAEEARGLAVDDYGRAYLCGSTNSTNFPAVAAYQPTLPMALTDAAFLSRFSTSGSLLDYSTYFGGSDSTFGYAVAAGSGGEAFLVGETAAGNFPVLDACQGSNAGGADAFAAEFASSGSLLLYSTYLGGSGEDRAYAVARDGEGRANLVGRTESADFPLRNPYQPARAGTADAFVARLSVSGSRLHFSTYLGGPGGRTEGLAVAASGRNLVYASGVTSSVAFPTRDPYQADWSGLTDAFLARLNFTSPTPSPLSPTPTPEPTASPTPSPEPSATPSPAPSSTPAPTASTAPTSSPPPTPSPSPSPTIVVCISVSGDVRDRTTTLPVSGASVRAVGPDGPSAIEATDAYGFYDLHPCTHLPSGAVRAEARHPDYLPAVVETAYADFSGVGGLRIEMMPASGAPGVVSSDYNGDGDSEIALFRPPSSQWAVRDTTRIYFGAASEDLVPADYDGDGTAEAAIFRPSTGMWAIHNLTRLYAGDFSDLAVPGDYDGDSTADLAVFRQRSMMWAVNRVTRIYFGASDDQPAGADFTGDGGKDFAVFRRSSGMWAVRDVTRIYFGAAGDRVVPGDYDGDGSAEAGIFRPASGLWSIRDTTRAYLGNSSDHPVPADYAGGGADRIGIFRESSGLWSIQDLTRAYFGATGDIPVSR